MGGRILSESLAGWPRNTHTARSTRAVAVHFDELLQVFNPERSESDDAVVARAVDPDHSIFGFHVDCRLALRVRTH